MDKISLEFLDKIALITCILVFSVVLFGLKKKK